LKESAGVFGIPFQRRVQNGHGAIGALSVPVNVHQQRPQITVVRAALRQLFQFRQAGVLFAGSVKKDGVDRPELLIPFEGCDLLIGAAGLVHTFAGHLQGGQIQQRSGVLRIQFDGFAEIRLLPYRFVPVTA
jgi:hypothetical protein